MAGSSWGTILKMTTWGESHGLGIGVVVDGCPAGLSLTADHIQRYLDRRKPGQGRYATQRKEGDQVEILSGVFDGRTTGTPISLLVRNTDQRSHDYSEIMEVYRPGHADYTFDEKYGFRDYRGGGRSSGRETIGRVAAGAIALSLLKSLGVQVAAYTKSIGDICISEDAVSPENLGDLEEKRSNCLCMPDEVAAKKASLYLDRLMEQKDSAGGVVECIITGVPAGIGEPVFEKLDAGLMKAIASIGAVKGVEIGDGFKAAEAVGSFNNDAFYMEAGKVRKKTNHAGGILGGMSDGSPIILRAAFKPTPSIATIQESVDKSGDNVEISIKGRHDPIIVPRAVVVVEAMAAFTVADMLLLGMASRMDKIREFYNIPK